MSLSYNLLHWTVAVAGTTQQQGRPQHWTTSSLTLETLPEREQEDGPHFLTLQGEDDPPSITSNSDTQEVDSRRDPCFPSGRRTNSTNGTSIFIWQKVWGTPGMIPGSNAAIRESSWACHCRSSLIKRSMTLCSGSTPDKTSAVTVLASSTTSLGLVGWLLLHLANVAS